MRLVRLASVPPVTANGAQFIENPGGTFSFSATFQRLDPVPRCSDILKSAGPDLVERMLFAVETGRSEVMLLRNWVKASSVLLR